MNTLHSEAKPKNPSGDKVIMGITARIPVKSIFYFSYRQKGPERSFIATSPLKGQRRTVELLCHRLAAVIWFSAHPYAFHRIVNCLSAQR